MISPFPNQVCLGLELQRTKLWFKISATYMLVLNKKYFYRFLAYKYTFRTIYAILLYDSHYSLSRQNKSTGELSFLTFFMNFSGSMCKRALPCWMSLLFSVAYVIFSHLTIFVCFLRSESFHQHPGKCSS